MKKVSDEKKSVNREYVLDIWWFYGLFFQCALYRFSEIKFWMVTLWYVFCHRRCSSFCSGCCYCWFSSPVQLFVSRFRTVCLSIFVQALMSLPLNLVYLRRFKLSQIIKRIDQHQIHWYYVYFDVYNTDAVCSKFFYVLFFYFNSPLEKKTAFYCL